MEAGTLCGPLHSEQGLKSYLAAVEDAKAQGGTVEVGGNVLDRAGYYVEPAVVTGLAADAPVVARETFAPVLYVLKCKGLDDAININNSVEQGLSSSIFTGNTRTIFLEKRWPDNRDKTPHRIGM